MIKVFLITISFISIVFANPYKQMPKSEKLSIFINYFLNEELKMILPKAPIKDQLKDDGASLDPIKHELYFNYIQRLRAIKQSRLIEQKKIDEKYEGQIAFHNKKLKSLKKYYQKEENLKPLLQKAINKAFKVVYGQPYFENLNYDINKNKFYGNLQVKDIYNIETFKPKNISIYIPKKSIKKFLKVYKNIQPIVMFFYDMKNKSLKFENIIFDFESIKYIADFINNNKNEIKLDIKINDDIFALLKP